MANITPWMTSDLLISSIQRKISFPISQATFTNSDILAFANEELMISQVPAVLDYHQEYFVTTLTIPLVSNQSHYPVPDRAIGMKLRGLFFADTQGNFFEMTRVQSEDRAFFQRNVGATQTIHKFYMEGNDVVVTPSTNVQANGSIMFVYYLRPNQLVTSDRAAIINSFVKNITINNSQLFNNDTITVGSTVFTAVTGSPSSNQFQIGASSTITAANLATAINTEGTYSSVSSNNVLSINYTTLSIETTSSNSSGIAVSPLQTIQFDNVPSNITNNSLIDFLQTKPGHKTRAFDIKVPNNGVSGNTVSFISTDVPKDLIIGDYICSQNECIIPQIPTDLHTSLAERTCARILAAIGDSQGLQMSTAKIQEIDQRQAPLINNRVEGNPQKVLARHTLLRYGKRGTFRRT